MKVYIKAAANWWDLGYVLECSDGSSMSKDEESRGRDAKPWEARRTLSRNMSATPTGVLESRQRTGG